MKYIIMIMLTINYVYAQEDIPDENAVLDENYKALIEIEQQKSDINKRIEELKKIKEQNKD